MMLAESNNHGHAYLRECQVLRYPNMWTGIDGNWWVTATASKLDIFDGLREMVESSIIQRLDQVTLGELRALQVKRITPEAPSGLHDDLAMAMALAYRALRDSHRTVVVRSTGNRIDEHKMSMRAERRRKQPLAWSTTK